MNLEDKAREYAEGKSSASVFRDAHIRDFKAGYNQALKDTRFDELLKMLSECKLQLEYLNEKFTETGTTNSLLSKIESLIKQTTEL